MFCCNCGSQISENAKFCPKCGAKVDNGEDIAYREKKAKDDFGQYINNHVRMTTKYQSAEELLNSKVSQKYVWVCFGVPAILLLILLRGAPFGVIIFLMAFMFLLIAYTIALLVDMILGGRAGVGEIRTKVHIDTDELILFLNNNLSYLSPYFHEWGYIKMVGAGAGGMLVADVQNEIMSTRIGTEFGHRKSCFVEIRTGPDNKYPDAGQMVYYFSTSMRLFKWWPAKYKCMVKAVPILQAAMEYYLKEHSTAE